MFKKFWLTVLFSSVCGAQGAAGHRPVFRLLYSPTPTEPGYPNRILEVDSGVFLVLDIRTSNQFGPSIMRLSSSGGTRVVYSFPPNTDVGSLVQGTDGKLYGSAFLPTNKSSYYFSIDLSGKNFQQYEFPDKWGSSNEMTVLPDGGIYDIVGRTLNTSALYAFARFDEGTGKIKFLHQFSGNDGIPDEVNLAYGPDGNLYSIGSNGQTPPAGFIFRVTPEGTYSQVLTFPKLLSDNPPLIAASDGNLYGTFSSGGANNTGEIYQAMLSGQLQVVSNFPSRTAMTQPEDLFQAADGNIYGGTNSHDIYRFNLTSKNLTSSYHMSPTGSQGHCPCTFIEGMDGRLYGTTPSGGMGDGVVFSLDLQLPRPSPLVTQVQPASGSVGKKVLLWGNYLLRPSSVTFNGIPATNFVGTSAHSVWATVPAGATTGPITISTTNGSFTTAQSFTVQ